MTGIVADFTDANVTGLSEYFIEKFNMIGTGMPEWKKSQFTLNHIPKDTEKLKNSDGFFETLKIADGWAGGPGWAKGNAYFFTSQKQRWFVEKPYAQYARMTFDNLLLAKTPTAQLIDTQGKESDGVKRNMLATLEFELWNDGSGNRGQILTLGGSEPTRLLTLANPSHVYNFVHNMVIFGRTGATGAGTEHTDLYKVTKLLPNTGQIEAIQLTNTGGQELAASDYLYAYGSDASYMPGIPTFIPSTDPSDTLLNVVRSGDPATSGWRFTFQSSMSYTLQYAFAQMSRYMDNDEPDYVAIVSTMDWLLLSQEREGRVVENPEATKKWGVTALTVRTPSGPIDVVSIPQVADGRGYILSWNSWCLYTLGNLPHVAMEDGKVFQRLGINDPAANAHPVTDGDGVEMRLRIWKVLLCKQPMRNATFETVAS
jgi:hypothetical protein